MKVKVADKSGMCYGVKRALELVEAESEISTEIATLGPLIHNPQVVDRLKSLGVRVVKSVDEVQSGTIVMPSHGVPRDILSEAECIGLKVIDATCPFVSKVHKQVGALADEGYTVVVIGDEGHSEVKAIMSAGGEGALVIGNAEEASRVDWSGKKVGVVCQTTQTPERFKEVLEVVKKSAEEVKAFNTICYATHDRQTSARNLCPQVDAMVVVGGKNSANTTRLAEICAESGVVTYHVEVADEICPDWFGGMDIIGLTAGASTPDWIIKEVIDFLERI